MNTMDELHFERVHKWYSSACPVMTAQSVAKAIKDSYTKDSLYADVEDEDGEHQFIRWDKKHGTSIKRIDVFTPHEEAVQDDLEVFRHGQKENGDWDILQSIQWMIDTAQILPEDKSMQLRILASRCKEIIAAGVYWFTEYEGVSYKEQFEKDGRSE